MSGEMDLKTLLRSLVPVIADGAYVFATLPDRLVPRALSPVMVFQEAEGTTLILNREEADTHGIPYEFPCRMITLNVHSSLEAVGFVAHIGAVLTRHGMGVNPVSGFYHDHLFIAEENAPKAMELLQQIARDA